MEGVKYIISFTKDIKRLQRWFDLKHNQGIFVYVFA